MPTSTLPRFPTHRSCRGSSRTDGKRCPDCIAKECHSVTRLRGLTERYSRIVGENNMILDGLRGAGVDVRDDATFSDLIAQLKAVEAIKRSARKGISTSD